MPPHSVGDLVSANVATTSDASLGRLEENLRDEAQLQNVQESPKHQGDDDIGGEWSVVNVKSGVLAIWRATDKVTDIAVDGQGKRDSCGDFVRGNLVRHLRLLNV